MDFLGEAIPNRIAGEMSVVFLAREALFLGRGDNLPIHHQGGGGIVIKGGKPQNCRHERPEVTFDARKSVTILATRSQPLTLK